MPQPGTPTHFVLVTAQATIRQGLKTQTWTATLTPPAAWTRMDAFDWAMTEFVRSNPDMTDHAVLYFAFERNEI
ncbi:hypothetical protein ACGFYY_25255 [Streptomyces sp. NPDC048331]|uniref:hypothetical protein n=1 Tax=Streptomyces sp. NPDC048331 TaxID=3365534 RepID=UPI003719E216